MTTTIKQAKIVLVDDHPIVREQLKEVIAREAGLKVCGEAESRHQALAIIAAVAPDLVIIDLSLKDSHGLDLIKDIHARYPQLLMLVLSMHDGTLHAERAIRAGAHGYITKQEATKKVLLAIRKVLDGEMYLSETVAGRVQKELQELRCLGNRWSHQRDALADVMLLERFGDSTDITGVCADDGDEIGRASCRERVYVLV